MSVTTTTAADVLIVTLPDGRKSAYLRNTRGWRAYDGSIYTLDVIEDLGTIEALPMTGQAGEWAVHHDAGPTIVVPDEANARWRAFNSEHVYAKPATVRPRTIPAPAAPEDPRLAAELAEYPYDAVEPAAYEAPTAAAEPLPDDATIQERFERFHAENPWVYNRLRRMALRLAEQGHRQFGVKMLMETLRHQTLTETIVPGTEPKLNNNYSSRYARLLAQNEPALAEVFHTRTLRS